MRGISAAALAALMLVSSSLTAADMPAASSLAIAEPGGVKKVRSEGETILLIVAVPGAADAIAVVAPQAQ